MWSDGGTERQKPYALRSHQALTMNGQRLDGATRVLTLTSPEIQPSVDEEVRRGLHLARKAKGAQATDQR